MFKVQNVLIAHQSTIPHYRIPFFNALERLRPSTWRFEVAFDHNELTKPRIFREPMKLDDFAFPILHAPLITGKIGKTRLSYQKFWWKAAHYDLLIVENAINNLTYPLSQLHQTHGVKVIYWGHGRDRSIETPSLTKTMAEQVKLWLARRADGFFTYTPRIKQYLVEQGLTPDKVFVINNTIDIEGQRRLYDTFAADRAAIRERLGVQQRYVLLFVGRFTPNKRLEFLLQAFAELNRQSNQYHLLLVGDGHLPTHFQHIPNLSHLGAITDPHALGAIFTVSDLFVFPGAVGLGPLQALCYDLPVLTIDSPTHGPEIEYLTSYNSLVLDASTTPHAYAQQIQQMFRDDSQRQRLRTGIWPSIRHLTIEQMAQNFIHGIDTLLSQPRSTAQIRKRTLVSLSRR